MAFALQFFSDIEVFFHSNFSITSGYPDIVFDLNENKLKIIDCIIFLLLVILLMDSERLKGTISLIRSIKVSISGENAGVYM